MSIDFFLHPVPVPYSRFMLYVGLCILHFCISALSFAFVSSPRPFCILGAAFGFDIYHSMFFILLHPFSFCLKSVNPLGCCLDFLRFRLLFGPVPDPCHCCPVHLFFSGNTCGSTYSQEDPDSINVVRYLKRAHNYLCGLCDLFFMVTVVFRIWFGFEPCS